jgi:hypothetical protein
MCFLIWQKASDMVHSTMPILLFPGAIKITPVGIEELSNTLVPLKPQYL